MTNDKDDDFSYEQDDADAWWKAQPESGAERKYTKGKPNTEEDKEEKVPIVYANKFQGFLFKDITKPELNEDMRVLHEAIFLRPFQKFVYVDNGKLGFTDEIDELYRKVKPTPLNEMFTNPYEFYSNELTGLWQEVQTKTIDDMFEESRNIWRLYLAAEPWVIDLFAATTIMSYFQDVLGMVFYIFLVGDSDTGKSAALKVAHQTFYRPYKAISVTEAVLYRLYGNVEEGQSILLLNEANKIPEKMMYILDGGYTQGEAVFRSDESGSGKSGRKNTKFFTYGLKLFSANKKIEGEGSKATNERIFYVYPMRAVPKMYIGSVLLPKNKAKFKAQLAQIDKFRKLMLLYRLKHFKDELPDLELSVSNRERELTEPMLSLFHNSAHRTEIIKSLSICLENRRKIKTDTMEALLYDIVNGFRDIQSLYVKVIPTIFSAFEQNAKDLLLLNPDNDIFAVPGKVIMDDFREKSESKWENDKETVMIGSEYGKVTTKKLSSILQDVFHGDKTRIGALKTRSYLFSKKKLDGLKGAYDTFAGLSVTE